MTYDPSGVGLPPEPPLDEPDDGYDVGWRRNGVGEFCSPGDVAAARRADAEDKRRRESERRRKARDCLKHEWSSARGDTSGREERFCYGCDARERRWRGGPWERDRGPLLHDSILARMRQLHGDTP